MEQGSYIFSCQNECEMINYTAHLQYLFVLTSISCIILKLQSRGGGGTLAIAGFWVCLPVQS